MGTPPGPLAAPSGKPRPSGWWFVGPAVLLVLAGALFAVMLESTINEVAQVDARVPADGETHRVSVGTDGDWMLFADSSQDRPPCVVTGSDGRVIEQRDVLGRFSMQRDGREWSGLTRFDPGDGEIAIRCPRDPFSPGGEVLVTPSVEVGGFIARVMLTIFGPMILGGIALLWALIIGILMFTRPAR